MSERTGAWSKLELMRPRREKAMLDALSAIAVAEQSRQEAVGTEVELSLLEWARNTAVDAFRLLASDEAFWRALEPATDEVGGSEAAVQKAQDIVSGELAVVLLRNGYTPPPPIGRLIHDARLSVAKAAGQSPAQRSHRVQEARSELEKLRTELEQTDPDSGSLRGLLGRAKRVLAAAAMVGPLVAAGIAGSVVDDAYEVTKAGIIEIVHDHASADRQQGRDLKSSAERDAELRDLELARQRARTRRAVAEAEKAKAEAELARTEARVAELKLRQERETERAARSGHTRGLGS